jgi:NADPH:quinone reductase-like Zn-dependent oxidoreductase
MHLHLITTTARQEKPPLPFVAGGEISGVIEETGAGVSALKRGDRVVALAMGASACSS